MSEADRLRALGESGLLHPNPETVAAPLFAAGGGFFLAADKVQVKYEMLRAHLVDQLPVTEAAAAHGYSRAAFYLVSASFDQLDERHDLRCHLPGPGRSDHAHVLGGPDPFQGGEVVERGLWHRGGGKVVAVQCLGDGEPGWRLLVAALEASRAAISASTRVRRNSSGLQRCVFAVISSSGASRRIAAIFSRFSPTFRSAARTGGLVLTTVLRPRSRSGR